MVDPISQPKTPQVSELEALSNNGQTAITRTKIDIPQVLKQLSAFLSADLLPKLPSAKTDSTAANLIGLSLDSLFAAVGNADRREACQSALSEIKERGEERKVANDKKLEELTKRIDKMASEKKVSGFLKIFKWIAKAVAAIATVVTIAAGALTANPLLIAAGVIMATLLIDSIVAEATEGKVSLTAGITKACVALGCSEETAAIIAIAVHTAIGITAAALTLGAGAGSVANTILNVTAKVAAVASGVSAVVQGSAVMAQAIIQYDIDESKIATKKLDALFERIKDAIEFQQAIVENRMKEAADLMSKVAEIVKSNNETQAIILGAGDSAPSFA